MQQLPFRRSRNLVARPAFSLPIALTALVLQANAAVLQASGSPWENAVNMLQVSFTSRSRAASASSPWWWAA